MYWNISTFQKKGKYTRHRLPLKHFTQKWSDRKWVKVTQKWLDQKWVKRKTDEDDWKVWDWEVIAMAIFAFRDRISSTRYSLKGKSLLLVCQVILAPLEG